MDALQGRRRLRAEQHVVTYQSNLELASAVLPQNASSSASLFIAAAPDAVYALALCRGDASAPNCAACLAVTFQDARQLCAYSREVAIYYDLCFSGRDFLVGADDNDEMYLLKMENVSAPAAAFGAAVAALISATADRAAADPTRRFTTGEEAPGGASQRSTRWRSARRTSHRQPAGAASRI